MADPASDAAHPPPPVPPPPPPPSHTSHEKHHCVFSFHFVAAVGLMKFFGGLARFHPKEVLGHFHTFMGMVFASIADQGDPSVKGLAIDTIGFIGSTPEGKSALDKQGGYADCVD